MVPLYHSSYIFAKFKTSVIVIFIQYMVKMLLKRVKFVHFKHTHYESSPYGNQILCRQVWVEYILFLNFYLIDLVCTKTINHFSQYSVVRNVSIFVSLIGDSSCYSYTLILSSKNKNHVNFFVCCVNYRDTWIIFNSTLSLFYKQMALRNQYFFFIDYVNNK